MNIQNVGDYSPTEAIKHAMSKYHFLLADNKIKGKISKLYNDLTEYESLYLTAELTLSDVALSVIKQKYSQSNGNIRSTQFILEDKQATVFSITLQDAILAQINPFNKFKEYKNKLEDPTYTFIIPNAASEIYPEDAERIFIEIQEKAGKEKWLIDYWRKKQELLNYILSILP